MGDKVGGCFFDGLCSLAVRSPFKIFLIASAELSVERTVEILGTWKLCKKYEIRSTDTSFLSIHKMRNKSNLTKRTCANLNEMGEC